MSEQTDPTRGAAEEASGTPLTETEVEASRRPPSAPAGDTGSGAGGGDDDERGGPRR